MQLLSDLKGIAEQLGVKNYKKLAKQELIYAILDTQASTPEKDLPAKKKAEEKSEKPERPKRVNVKKEKAEKPLRKKEAVDFEKSADELLQSFDLELEALDHQSRRPAHVRGTTGTSYLCRKNSSRVVPWFGPRICGFCMVMLPSPSMYRTTSECTSCCNCAKVMEPGAAIKRSPT